MATMTTDKKVCCELAALLYEHAVRHIVVSPGSRNAPIIVALARSGKFNMIPVIDERSAGFVALGIASQSLGPVAIVCTSGTALLNYAPSVAEAYYRQLPIIVISADRPMEWIDQDDSQTIRQPGALDHYVKKSYDIPDIPTPDNIWYANRVINEALTLACTGRRSPVHINLQLNEPLNRMNVVGDCNDFRVVRTLAPREDLSVARSREIGRTLDNKKVMIVVGFHRPDQRLNKALSRLARKPGFVVLTESISNMHSSDFITRIDTTLSAMTEKEECELVPDVVITMGGALVSRLIKKYIRDHKPSQHWHVGVSRTMVDCFKSLTMNVEMDAGIFMAQLASAVQPLTYESNYSDRWHIIADRAISTHDAYVAKSPWSDMKAFSVIMPMLPRRWNLQLSNGTPIRYVQLFNNTHIHRSDCNRGVSGIDGCTSTAIGASIAYTAAPTLLITGDMSAQYDIGALACQAIGGRFKMIVICNGGGGIFRFISSTSRLDELDAYFAMDVELPLRQLAEGYNFEYFEAYDEKSLRYVMPHFMAESNSPAILAVHTPAEQSAEVLKNYFTRHLILHHNEKLDNN